MKWSSLLWASAVALSLPCNALAIKSASDIDTGHTLLASNAPAPAASTATSSPDQSAELQTLEKRFFRHDFTNQPMEERLDRMEKFTFGETVKGPSQARLNRIASVLDKHSGDTPLVLMTNCDPIAIPMGNKPKRSADAPRTFMTAGDPMQISMIPTTSGYKPPIAPPPPDDDDGGTDYPHITYLENEMLGQAFQGQSLSQRLARLETKAFGSPSGNPDFSARTDALERYAENRLHKKAFDQHPMDDEDGGGFGSMPPLPNMNRPLASREDAEASLPTPPPEGARLLSRVAWCEQHMFGRTYPEMHLIPRLHQLNAAVFPNDKSRDMELMDHVDAIVKEIAIRQHPPTK